MVEFVHNYSKNHVGNHLKNTKTRALRDKSVSKINEKCKKVSKSAPGRSLDGLGHQPCNSKVDLWRENVTPKGDFGAKLGGQVGPKSLFLIFVDKQFITMSTSAN